MNRKKLALLVTLIALTAAACVPAPTIDVGIEPSQTKFNSERAFALETEFATTFLNRHSGTPENQRATEWIKSQFEARGWNCSFDDWEVVLYSQDVPLRNVVCTLPGVDPRQILVVAHHDQASTTIQGANNDASGIAILLEMAENFALEAPPRYSLVFVATDAEEYGMLGSLRYAQTHPDTENIIAGISLDNLGHSFYTGMNIELTGQGQGVGPIWLALTAREAARAAGSTWEVNMLPPLDQVTSQLAPVSAMDQGPLAGAGIPAIGFIGETPNTARSLPDDECLERQDIDNYPDLKYATWHAPEDTMACQSPGALGQSGIIAEGLVRQLLSMGSFPQESGPYLYLESSEQVLRGFPLMLIFIAFMGVFFLGSYAIGPSPLRETLSGWLKALPHYLSLWLPLVASVLLSYIFTKIGVLLDFELYAATTKDPYLLNPDWFAITLILIAMAIFFILGRRLLKGLSRDPVHEFKQAKSLTMLVIGLSGIYIILNNPFSLVFLVPTLFWFLIRDWDGSGRLLNILWFLLGGLVIYAMIYFQGFLFLRLGLRFLWMMVIMIAVQTFGFATMLASTAVIAGGLLLLIKPPAAK